jgi:hypothetical protein
MADNVTYTAAADSTPPAGTKAATDELSDGSHAGLAKLLVSADGDRTAIPATVVDGLLVETSNPGLTDAELRATPVPVAQTNLGQQVMADSLSVTVASDQTDIPITGAVTTDGLTDAELRATPVPISGTVTANAGTNLNTSLLALEAGGNLASIAASASVLDDWDESDRAKVNPIVGQAGVAAGTGTDGVTVQRVSLATNVALPAGSNNIGDVDIASLPNEGQQTMANSISVAVASDQSNLPTKETRAATSAVTSVADTATSTTLLASNANRLGASIANDSSSVLYVKFGTTASATDYTVRLSQYAYYEVPFNYTGRIDGIWATDPGDGAARITELTA